MPTVLLFLEFLGTSEMLLIALVALMVFGPRKLPEIGRTVGKSIAEFKRASEDFKRTWEYEVETERRQIEARSESGTGDALRERAEGGQTAPGAYAGEPHEDPCGALTDPAQAACADDAETAAAAEVVPGYPVPASRAVARGSSEGPDPRGPHGAQAVADGVEAREGS